MIKILFIKIKKCLNFLVLKTKRYLWSIHFALVFNDLLSTLSWGQFHVRLFSLYLGCNELKNRTPVLK